MAKIEIGIRKLTKSRKGRVLNIPSLVLKQIEDRKDCIVEMFFDVEEKKLEIFFKNN